MNYDYEYVCKCKEPEEIYEIFILDDYSFLLCGSCRAEYIKECSQ